MTPVRVRVAPFAQFCPDKQLLRKQKRRERETVDTALNLAMIILSVVLIGLVVVQARTPGMSNRDTSSIYRTRRGLEKTLHQTTVLVAVLFLVLALVASLPIYGPAPMGPPAPPA
jgi:preprotein translocase subunit SecG